MAEFVLLSAVIFLHLKVQNKQTSALKNNIEKKVSAQRPCRIASKAFWKQPSSLEIYVKSSN